jgi:hypothetical protein
VPANDVDLSALIEATMMFKIRPHRCTPWGMLHSPTLPGAFSSDAKRDAAMKKMVAIEERRPRCCVDPLQAVGDGAATKTRQEYTRQRFWIAPTDCPPVPLSGRTRPFMPEGADAARAGMRLLEISRTLQPWIREEAAAHGAFFGWDADRNFAAKNIRNRGDPITTSLPAQMERDDVQALCKCIIDALVPADQRSVTGLYIMNLDRNGPVRLASFSKTASVMHAFVLDDCDDDGLMPDACHYIWQESPNGRSVLGPLGYNYVTSTYPCPNIIAKATEAITGEYVPFMGIGVEVAQQTRLMFRLT